MKTRDARAVDRPVQETKLSLRSCKDSRRLPEVQPRPLEALMIWAKYGFQMFVD